MKINGRKIQNLVEIGRKFIRKNMLTVGVRTEMLKF